MLRSRAPRRATGLRAAGRSPCGARCRAGRPCAQRWGRRWYLSICSDDPLPFALWFTAPLLRLVLRDFMDSGERCPIFLREGRFAALESGTGIDYVLVRPETPGGESRGDRGPRRGATGVGPLRAGGGAFDRHGALTRAPVR